MWIGCTPNTDRLEVPNHPLFGLFCVGNGHSSWFFLAIFLYALNGMISIVSYRKSWVHYCGVKWVSVPDCCLFCLIFAVFRPRSKKQWSEALFRMVLPSTSVQLCVLVYHPQYVIAVSSKLGFIEREEQEKEKRKKNVII